MKRILDFIKKYSFLLFVIVLIISFFVPRIIYNNNRKKLFAIGQKGIAYVYDESGAKATVFSSKYYFYVNEIKVEGICATPRDCFSIGKFYLVYYLPNDQINSTLDFKQEIIPELVYKYFPQGKNPFELEVRRAIEARDE